MNASHEQKTPPGGEPGLRHHCRATGFSPIVRAATSTALLLVLAISTSGCLVRSRERIKTFRPPSGWKEATLPELLENLRKEEESIKTLNATVDVEPSISSAQKGEVVHYRDVRSFLMIRKPGLLRMIGQYPVVRNTAFDLASDGNKFELYVPSKDRLVIGSAVSKKHSATALENLRPHHILDALLWRSPDPINEKAALEVIDEPTQSHYVVNILATNGNGELVLKRKLWYERARLTLDRLQIYDPGGILATDATYSNYGEFNGIRYPQNIIIDRPQDQYGLALTITRLVFNEDLGDEKFKMEMPAGATIVNLEDSAAKDPNGSTQN
jgi:outer membrane lipoprotein-sorting protein